jgi:NADH-quinone oxidoreductase subunit G
VMGTPLGVGDVAAVRAALRALPETRAARPAPPAAAAAERGRPGPGQAILATWHHLLDLGTLQQNEDHLAGTARPSRALLSAATAREIGVALGNDGQPASGTQVTVATERGALTLPLTICDMAERVVWVPMRSAGSEVRSALGAGAGSLVEITVAGLATAVQEEAE